VATVRIPFSIGNSHYEIALSIGGARNGFVDLFEAVSITAADTFVGDVALFRNAHWDFKKRDLSTGRLFENKTSLWLVPFVGDELRKALPVRTKASRKKNRGNRRRLSGARGVLESERSCQARWDRSIGEPPASQIALRQIG
jgi:hypothetical protein